METTMNTPPKREHFRQLIRLIGHAIPDDNSDQYEPFRVLSEYRSRMSSDKPALLDYGAGIGGSYNSLKEILPAMDYTGIDVGNKAPDTSKGFQILQYDGDVLPFEESTYDIVFSKQVLEHVRYPDNSVSDIYRVLKSGGAFIGSVSFIETYHARSIFNWSPFGIVRVFQDNGFQSVELRPGVDGGSMVMRNLFGREHFRSSFRGPSIFNHHVDIEHQLATHQERNAMKLVFSAHICFCARKP